ncbi:MAG: ribosomal protein S18-alanine N-acetyltransferase [Hyphomicrobiales bacterium]
MSTSPGVLRILPMTVGRLDEIVAIERASFSDPWSREMFRSEITLLDGSYARVAELEGKVVGYLLAILVVDEAHLGNLAVHPDHRRAGIAQRLLDDLLRTCRRTGVRRVTLEVRESNEGARKFYYRNEFIDVAIRKNYYRHPTEDAIVMLRTFPEESVA